MVEYLIEYFTGSQRATLYFPTLNSNYIYQQGEIRFHPNAVDIIYGSPTGKTLSSPISKSLSEVKMVFLASRIYFVLSLKVIVKMPLP